MVDEYNVALVVEVYVLFWVVDALLRILYTCHTETGFD